ncbi:MAG: ammonium transporter, partial [Terriglobia bacterium]
MGQLAPDNSVPLTGLFDGGTRVLAAQAIGSVTITIATFVVALAVMHLVNAMGILCASAEGEA